VVSVVGCRGLGKTTLAKVVFDSFDDVPCRAWVVASDCKDVRALLQEIYSKLPGEKEDTTTSSLAELGKYLSAHLGEQQK
jgi:disease resistance protein RPM1